MKKLCSSVGSDWRKKIVKPGPKPKPTKSFRQHSRTIGGRVTQTWSFLHEKKAWRSRQGPHYQKNGCEWCEVPRHGARSQYSRRRTALDQRPAVSQISMWVDRIIGVKQKFRSVLYVMAGVSILSLTFGITAVAAYADQLPEPIGSIWVPPRAEIVPIYEDGSPEPIGYAVMQGDRRTTCRMIMDDTLYTCASK